MDECLAERIPQGGRRNAGPDDGRNDAPAEGDDRGLDETDDGGLGGDVVSVDEGEVGAAPARPGFAPVHPATIARSRSLRQGSARPEGGCEAPALGGGSGAARASGPDIIAMACSRRYD